MLLSGNRGFIQWRMDKAYKMDNGREWTTGRSNRPLNAEKWHQLGRPHFIVEWTGSSLDNGNLTE